MDSEHVFEQLVAQSLESCCILLNVGLYGSLNTFCHETADFEIYTYIITQIVNAFQVYLFMHAHTDLCTHTKKINTLSSALCHQQTRECCRQEADRWTDASVRK